MTEFRNLERGFEDAPRMGRPSTITTNENVEAVQWIEMRDQQVSVRRIPYRLGILKTIIHEIMNNHMGMKKVWTRCRPKFFTPIQRPFRVYCVAKSSCNRAKEIQSTFLIAS